MNRYALNIKTDKWKLILGGLKERGWTVSYRYDAFDARIDFDLAVLTKEGQEILMG